MNFVDSLNIAFSNISGVTKIKIESSILFMNKYTIYNINGFIMHYKFDYRYVIISGSVRFYRNNLKNIVELITTDYIKKNSMKF